MGLRCEVSRLLTNALQSHSGAVSLPLHYLQQILSLTGDLDISEGKELTFAEIHNHECHRLVADALLSEAFADLNKFDEILDKIKDWLEGKGVALNSRPSLDTYGTDGVSRFGDVQTPTWVYLHSSFSKLETLQLLSLFAAVASKRSKSAKSKTLAVTKERIASLQELVASVQSGIHDSAKKLKEELNAPGVLGKLFDVALGRTDGEKEDTPENPVGVEIEKLCDAATLETLCGDMRESWEDALDGILAVKTKLFK